MDLDRALGFSRYATRVLEAEPALRDELAATLDTPFSWTEATAVVAAATAEGDPDRLARELRWLRRRVIVHTLARDLTGRAALPEVVGAVTRLAEVALGAAVALHHRRLAVEFGEPRPADGGAPESLVVIGMGKLGGGELNVSSDVDLVFVYADEGETDGGRRVANREFFDRLGRQVIAALDEVTADGNVFRVDMRLRPYGDSGPLTLSYGALEQYLITQGRAWERYAWLKARPLTGMRHDELEALVAPFVYRKYLDYDAYNGLREVHRQIRAEGRRRDAANDIKIGSGGIREIEFIVQAQQIVRGGREPELRARPTRAALALLGERGLLPARAVRALDDAYVFLRTVEHRLQYRDDRQTQALPRESTEFAALAMSLGLDAAALRVALDRHRGAVAEQFDSLFGDLPADARPGPGAPALAAVWDTPSEAGALERLAAAGFSDPRAVAAMLAATRSGPRYAALPDVSRRRFDALVPQLLAAAAAEPGDAGAQTVFTRLFALLETVARRSAYLALIIEHPPLLPRLAQLIGASAWAADYLIRHPILLDELLDARALLAEPDWTEWQRELDRHLAAHPGDAERQMDDLRHFQHAQTFRLLAQDLAGRLSVERLADHLSALADIVLAATLRCCWRQMDAEASPRFAVVGYGKLGGKELGYVSDLDLVFLYDLDSGDPDAEGLPQRYARLAQRVNTWLTSTTAAGQLYETDLRLRPDGASGLMVSSLEAFRRYQRTQAWTWEHQALTRARFVAGDAPIGAAFEAEREAILRLPRDRGKLAADVIAMRRRMHAGHANPTALFDLKHGAGGMVDIEFIVQFLVLAHAGGHQGLTRNAGNIALLALAGDLGLAPPRLAADVADAYRAYRRQQHAVRLQGAHDARVDPAPHTARRAAVDALWQHVFGAPWTGAPGRIG